MVHMNYYDIWFNLKDSHRDMELVANVNAYLGHLQKLGKIAGFRLRRRKLGFGPPELGEFSLSIWTETLAQLDAAFDTVATRSGEVEQIHSRVYSMVTDFRSALYRDFPDPQRPA
jgi:hypothetical protein